jgi:hypothetical protein
LTIDRKFREIRIKNSRLSTESGALPIDLQDDLSIEDFPTEILLASFRSSPAETVTIDLALEVKPSRWDPWSWGDATYSVADYRIRPGIFELLLENNDGADDKIRLICRMDRGQASLSGWHGRYSRFGYLRDNVRLELKE